MTGAHTPSVADAPAFPIPDERDADGCGIREGSRGMTLRDYFAGQALTGLIASPNMQPSMRNEDYAAVSYGLADAMLAVRATSKEAQDNE